MDKDEGWSIIDKNGKVIVEDEYPSDARISKIYDGVYWVKSGDKYQLFSIDDPKKPVMDEEFDYATDFHAGRAVVAADNQPIRIIDTSGKTKLTLDKSVKRCGEFSEDGYALFVNSDKKCGIIDKYGKVTVKATYAFMTPITDGVVLALKKEEDEKEKADILDTKGKKLGTINLKKYKIKEGYSEGKIVVRNTDSDNARQEVLDKEGKKLFTIKKSSGNNYSKYKDGYITFTNSEDKYGIVDGEGNEIIRPKYERMMNLGNGEFAVSKDGDKWGIVNIEDEEILPFEYSGVKDFMLGENYVVVDGSEILLLKKGEQKPLATFYDVSLYGASSYAEYIDVDHIVNKIMSTIEEYEKPRTAPTMAQDFKLDIDDYKWGYSISRNVEIDDVYGDVAIHFPTMTRRKRHYERVYNGYYSYDREVDDGWEWVNELPSSINGTLRIYKSGVFKAVYKTLKDHLAKGRTKGNNETYSRGVNYNGNEMTVYTSLSTDNDDKISFTINYDYNRYIEDDNNEVVEVADSIVEW